MFKKTMDIASFDPELAAALASEARRQEDHIELIASENYASPRVLAAQGSVLTNKYAEGYPGKRYYGGCEYVDIAEQLAIDRAKALFGAEHANVQPHSGAQANAAVYHALLTPGDTIYTTAIAGLRITAQGATTAVLLIARVETAVTFTTLLVLCTPWMHVLKALRAFHLPQEVVMMLAMTHRYIFLLAETASQMFESRQSRTVGVLDSATQRRVITRTAGVLLSKSVELSNDVFLAMQSRGFRGDVKILSEFRMRIWDYVGLTAFLAVGAFSVWMGRS